MHAVKRHIAGHSTVFPLLLSKINMSASIAVGSRTLPNVDMACMCSCLSMRLASRKKTAPESRNDVGRAYVSYTIRYSPDRYISCCFRSRKVSNSLPTTEQASQQRESHSFFFSPNYLSRCVPFLLASASSWPWAL